MAKERRTINVSLQSKKYLEPVNQILNEWEDDSLNLSTQICETLLLMKKLKSSGTFNNVLAVYELIERAMKVYDIQDHAQLERLLAEVITINHSKLGKVITNLNPELDHNITKPAKPHAEKAEKTVTASPKQIEKPEFVQSVVFDETKTETKIVDENDDNDSEIPLDFLMNS